MNTTFSILLVLSFISAETHFAQSGILSSQIGYDTGYPVRVMIRSDQRDYLSDDAIFEVVDMKNESIINGPVEEWGKKWESYWWVADLSQLKIEGRYLVKIQNKDHVFLTSDTIEVGRNVLWSKCFKTIAFDFLQSRSEQARTGKGWRDCGSDLQEFSSHMVAVDALCDILKTNDHLLTQNEKEHIIGQILIGSEYLTHLQDKADSLGFGNGPVVHEDRQIDVVTGNVVKASMIFAKVSQILQQVDPQKSKEYIDRAKKAFVWIERNGPIVNPEEQIFFPSVHGAPQGTVPPKDQWMTRDLVMMIYAAVEIFKTGDNEYKDKAVRLARQLVKRQVPQDEDEEGFYGHFYTYDDYTEFGNIRFTEKANIHCGAWSKEGRIYNKGGHYPHYLMPVIEMINLWPSHQDSDLWRKTLHDFAYGYFLPVLKESPFLILPSGYYHKEGLLYFSSWYHGHNNIYAFAASLALEFQKYFQDDRFLEIAIGNIQWIAGLNCGWKQEGSQQYESFSMITGIGSRNLESWTKIPGTIINGFSASEQFKIQAPSLEKDLPVYLDDEGYIAHSLPYLAALARLRAYSDKHHFDLVKTESLIAPPESMGDENFTAGAYYTTLVKMDGIKDFPYDYALYFSTDHASDNGGIWLYLCNGKPSQAANWISYDEGLASGKFDYLTQKPANNPIYADTIRGRQTETPHANVIDGKVYMSYHNYLYHSGWQATMMAISDDGVNYKRIFDDDRAIVLKPIEFLDHTGYFRWGRNIFTGVDYKYVGYSLRKGTIDYRSSMWGSNDAIHWDELQMINGWKTDKSIPEADRFLIWHEMDPTSVRKIRQHEYAAICCAGTRAAGQMKRLTEIYEVYLAEDGCTQTRMARKIMGVGSMGSDDSEECSSPSVTFHGDSLHMVYVGTAESGRINTVMGAVGVFNARAILTPELSDSLRQYHFYSREEYEKELLLNRK